MKPWMSFVVVICIGLVSCSTSAFDVTKAVPGRMLGCWRAAEIESKLLRIERDRVLISENGRLSVRGVAGFDGGQLRLYKLGELVSWRIRIDGGGLLVDEGQGAKLYHPVTEIPPALDLKPAPLGKQATLDSERIEHIRNELSKRAERDREVRSSFTPLLMERLRADTAGTLKNTSDYSWKASENGSNLVDADSAAAEEFKKNYMEEFLQALQTEKGQSLMAEMMTMDAGNTDYLRRLIGEIGWIDVKRFGEDASAAACLIVQHSGDVGLMTAALPEVKKDVRYDKIRSIYGLMLYRLNQYLGAAPDELERIRQEHGIR